MLGAADPYTRFIPPGYADSSPELRYAIRFSHTGTYKVWIRALSTTAEADSCHEHSRQDVAEVRAMLVDVSSVSK